jgi:hypothetical protein
MLRIKNYFSVSVNHNFHIILLNIKYTFIKKILDFIHKLNYNTCNTCRSEMLCKIFKHVSVEPVSFWNRFDKNRFNSPNKILILHCLVNCYCARIFIAIFLSNIRIHNYQVFLIRVIILLTGHFFN